MADKTITVAAPDANTPGVDIHLSRTATGVSATVVYVANGVTSVAQFSEAEVAATTAVRNAVITLFAAAMAPTAAPARMGF